MSLTAAQLAPEEDSFLSKHMTASMAAFEGVSAGIGASPCCALLNWRDLIHLGENTQQALLTVAASSVKKAQQ